MAQQARAQQAKSSVQQLQARISAFPGPTSAGPLSTLADAEAQVVAGTFTPQQFWDWIAQGNASITKKEQADFGAKLALAAVVPAPVPTPVRTPVRTPVAPSPTARKRTAADSDDNDESVLTAWQTAAYQPVDGCLSGKAASLFEAVQEVVVAISGAPAQRNAFLASDRVEQDAKVVARKEARQLQILHQCVTRQEGQDKLLDLQACAVGVCEVFAAHDGEVDKAAAE